MGLTVTLANALSGMKTTQDGLSVLSRNVANAGSTRYHRQDVVVEDRTGGSSTYASFVGVARAFSESIERAYVRELSDTAYANVRSRFLSNLETAFGLPGDANSLDTLVADFTNALEALSISPEDYATRAMTVSAAQDLAQQLNALSTTVQELRQETETQMTANVDTLNQSLRALQAINSRLSDYSLDESSRLSVLDERDRLISQVSEIVDTKVTYRDDGTVAMMTHSGLSLLDQGATTFSFEPVGTVSATSLYSIDDAENGVGTLTSTTPSGLTLDVFDQKIIQSGSLAALVDMRDTILPQVQAQLDTVAAALSQALSTNVTGGTAVSGPPDGFDIDLSEVQSGNTLGFSYTQAGKSYDVKVVRVEDSSLLPMDYTNANGERVIGLSFAGGASDVASQLGTIFGSAISFSATGSTLEIRDDGGVNTTIASAETRTTSSALQNDGLGINLFVDLNNQSFTNSLDGTPQLRGYASRISVNTAIANDNSLLVQHVSGGSLGDADRIDYLLDGLENTVFTSDNRQVSELGSYRLTGNVHNLVNQVINYQGNQIASAHAALDTQQIALDAVDQRREAEYGVDIDEEMARLIELQNAYSASARVVSVAQELIDALMKI